MFSVHQPWDRLKVCAVGRSYPPEFYDYIKNKKVRNVFYRIAEETEEDYALLVTKLESFGVQVERPIIESDPLYYFNGLSYRAPPMQPRDYSVMIGNIWYTSNSGTHVQEYWDMIKGVDYPTHVPKTKEEFDKLPQYIIDELNKFNFFSSSSAATIAKNINELVTKQGNHAVYNNHLVNGAMTTRVGKDLYFGTESYNVDLNNLKKHYAQLFPDYRCHVINTGGHSDGTFCPVSPGLIISLHDVPTYADTFPGWEVIYLPGQSWTKVDSFLKLKEKNRGKWWVPGEELNSEFTDFVETWMQHWTGYVEETVFDVNMLVIDKHNIICNNYNKEVFDAFDRYGITGHIVNFRHRYFWDGGLHCITSDLHREGIRNDYFPERG